MGRHRGFFLGGLSLFAGLLLPSGDLGRFLGRAEHHAHVSAFLEGLRFNHCQTFEVFVESLEEVTPALGVGLLAAAEHDRDLDLVLGLQETLDVALLGVVVVDRDLGPELDLTDVDLGLVLAGLLELLLLLVAVLRVVEKARDRGLGARCDFDKIEFGLPCHLPGVVGADDADLLTVGSDEPDLGHADALVGTSRVPFWGTAVKPARNRH